MKNIGANMLRDIERWDDFRHDEEIHYMANGGSYYDRGAHVMDTINIGISHGIGRAD